MRLIILILFSIITVSYSGTDSYIGIRRFSIEPAASEFYNSLDILLFQRLSFELLPQGVKPLLLTDSLCTSCIAFISATIESVDNEPVLTFTISGISESGGQEIKKIPIREQSADALVDILAIKVRHFLEQNISGKLRITSSPLDCDILLNGVKIGKSPAELVLEQGTYHIELQREYLSPYKDSVRISAGQESSLSATMRFQGHSLKPWVYSGLFFTGGVLLSQIFESKFHTEYSTLETADGATFTKKWNHYRLANTIKIAFLIPMATSWTITGYQAMENRSLKRKIFDH